MCPFFFFVFFVFSNLRTYTPTNSYREDTNLSLPIQTLFSSWNCRMGINILLHTHTHTRYMSPHYFWPFGFLGNGFDVYLWFVSISHFSKYLFPNLILLIHKTHYFPYYHYRLVIFSIVYKIIIIHLLFFLGELYTYRFRTKESSYNWFLKLFMILERSLIFYICLYVPLN